MYVSYIVMWSILFCKINDHSQKVKPLSMQKKRSQKITLKLDSIGSWTPAYWNVQNDLHIWPCLIDLDFEELTKHSGERLFMDFPGVWIRILVQLTGLQGNLFLCEATIKSSSSSSHSSSHSSSSSNSSSSSSHSSSSYSLGWIHSRSTGVHYLDKVNRCTLPGMGKEVGEGQLFVL